MRETSMENAPQENRNEETKGTNENKDGWIDVMDMEPMLLESDVQIRCQGFLPSRKPGDSTWSVQHSSPWQSEKLVLQKDNPFEGLKISPTDPINEQSGREPCPKCFKSRKFFCYSCYVPVESLQPHVPKIRIPIKIDVVKHAREVEGKSTAVHAPIIAPDDVKMYIFPHIPDYREQRALLVFPGDDSKTLSAILEDAQKSTNSASEESAVDPSSSSDQQPQFPYDKIVFIDSTWNQCKGMHRDPRLASLPCVIISSRNTIFWRYQRGKPKEYLATIEAIYYFLVDFHQIVLKLPYSGEYDNILFFFKFMYNKIHELYDHDKLRAYNWD